MMNRILIGALAGITVAAVARVAALEGHLDDIEVYTDSLKLESCRGGTITNIETGSCRRRRYNPRPAFIYRFAVKIDSIEAAFDADPEPPEEPVNIKPSPNWNFTCDAASNSCSYNATASTDDKGIVSYTWRAAGKTTLTGALQARMWDAGGWTEWMIVQDQEGLKDSLSRVIPVKTLPSPPTDAVAALPQSTPEYRDPYPGRSCTTTVANGGNVNAALVAARGGQVVCLAAGGTYGAVTIPARAVGDTGWIVLRTTTTIPSEGVRVKPSTATTFATIRQTTGECSLLTTPGTNNWFIAGVKFTTTFTSGVTFNIVCLGSTGTEQDVLSEVPQRLILSRVVVDGGSGDVQRCIVAQSGNTAIVDSWLMNCHIKGFEGHGIGGWNSPGPLLIRNNTIEASGINIMVGGATPSIANLRTTDITITLNHAYKPLAWKDPHPTLPGGLWTAKNLLETKNADNVLVEANVFQNSWTDAQTGIGILFKSANDQGNCTWCQTTDVTFRWNKVVNAETALSLNGGENYNDVSNAPPAMSRVHILENVFDSIGVSGGNGSKGLFYTPVHSTTGGFDWVYERNVVAQYPGLLIGAGMILSPHSVQRGVFRDNVMSHGFYTLLDGEGIVGAATLSSGAPLATWSNMCFVKLANHTDATVSLPSGSTVVNVESSCTLAATIRAIVASKTSGVVVSP